MPDRSLRHRLSLELTKHSVTDISVRLESGNRSGLDAGPVRKCDSGRDNRDMAVRMTFGRMSLAN